MVLVRILMSKSGFEDEVVLIKLIASWGCEACHKGKKFFPMSLIIDTNRY
jgi:hypothetical protein